ncbi:MAG: hypothetical protein AAF654_11225 [Myxococcota bacterium]
MRVTLPKDPTKATRTYTLLTIGDPCVNCDRMPCADFPPEVGAYPCKDGLTANGQRVRDGALTAGRGRLVFAVLDNEPEDPAREDEIVARCEPSTDADPVALDPARINSRDEYSNTASDLCQ